MFYDDDVDLLIIQGCKVGVIGYGSQGYVYLLSLCDLGVQVCVGLKQGLWLWFKVEEQGLDVDIFVEVVKWVDVVMVLVFDIVQVEIFVGDIEFNFKFGDVLFFGYGFNVYFGLIKLFVDVVVVMVVLKGLGYLVCCQFVDGKGVLCLVVVEQDL